MDEKTTRRDVLRAATTTGAVVTFGALEGAASTPSVHLIESGIKYELPERDDYDRFHFDSRPEYTVDSQGNKLIRKGRSRSREQKATKRNTPTNGSKLVNDQVAKGGSVSLNSAGTTVEMLPTSLSARKQVVEAVNLDGRQKLPAVDIRMSERGAMASVQSHGEAEIPPSDTRRVTLDARTVEVRTKRTIDELADVESMPDWQVSKKREYGTATVEVTPTVEIVNHGEVKLQTEPLP